MIKFNHDWRYDLEVGQEGENFVSKILRNGNESYTVEVKFDTRAHETKNFYIEYASRGKKSGVLKSQADYYCMMTVNESFCLMVKTDHLRKAMKAWKNKCIAQDLEPSNTWQKRGGDNLTSVGMLIPARELIDEILRVR